MFDHSARSVIGSVRLVGKLLGEGWLGNRVAGLRYRVAESDVYRYPGGPGITSDKLKLPTAEGISRYI